MSDDGPILSTTVIIGALLGLLCCAAPLIVAILLTDLAVQFASTGRVLTFALVGLVAAVGFLILRQRTHGGAGSAGRHGEAPASDDCCSSVAAEKDASSAP